MIVLGLKVKPLLVVNFVPIWYLYIDRMTSSELQ